LKKRVLAFLVSMSIIAALSPIGVFASLFPWHSAQLIDNNAGEYAYSPQVVLSGMNAVAVWHQWDGYNYRIYSNYSGDSGATWQGAQLIENNTGKEGQYPQVAMYGANAVAVWRQWDGSAYRIYSNYSTDSGKTWTPGNAQIIEKQYRQRRTISSGGAVRHQCSGRLVSIVGLR
jgi:hypothetical protein